MSLAIKGNVFFKVLWLRQSSPSDILLWGYRIGNCVPIIFFFYKSCEIMCKNLQNWWNFRIMRKISKKWEKTWFLVILRWFWDFVIFCSSGQNNGKIRNFAISSKLRAGISNLKKSCVIFKFKQFNV